MPKAEELLTPSLLYERLIYEKKVALGLLSVLLTAEVFSGCGEKDAAETASESAKLEEEGSGESADEEEEEEEEPEEEVLRVGVLLPGEEDGTWARDAEALAGELETDGYTAQICYAGEDGDLQESQIRELLEEEDLQALIVAPVDSYGLTEVLEEADELSVPVFSYDRLIMDTDAVTYYATYNVRAAGNAAAQRIIDDCQLEKVREAGETLYIEFFMGSPDDLSALFYFNGVKETLQTYLEDGTLVCASGRESFDDAAIIDQSESAAKTKMESVLEEFYKEEQAPDIIVTGYDNVALGIVEALEESGLSAGEDEWPYITGSGCEAQAVTGGILEGSIVFSVFMIPRPLPRSVRIWWMQS
ncbi:MAG: substrate-binding domain-containing protein [Clostridiales bacterium]|nr:substrate-binding domain-containing protein [Clostridiales bacterium]